MNHAHLFVVVVRAQVLLPLSCLCVTYLLSLSPSSSLSLSKSQRKQTDVKPQQFVFFFLIDPSVMDEILWKVDLWFIKAWEGLRFLFI